MLTGTRAYLGLDRVHNERVHVVVALLGVVRDGDLEERQVARTLLVRPKAHPHVSASVRGPAPPPAPPAQPQGHGPATSTPAPRRRPWAVPTRSRALLGVTTSLCVRPKLHHTEISRRVGNKCYRGWRRTILDGGRARVLLHCDGGSLWFR